jgi:hypothetical protein
MNNTPDFKEEASSTSMHRGIQRAVAGGIYRNDPAIKSAEESA